jgi:hypothetical protein
MGIKKSFDYNGVKNSLKIRHLLTCAENKGKFGEIQISPTRLSTGTVDMFLLEHI